MNSQSQSTVNRTNDFLLFHDPFFTGSLPNIWIHCVQWRMEREGGEEERHAMFLGANGKGKELTFTESRRRRKKVETARKVTETWFTLLLNTLWHFLREPAVRLSVWDTKKEEDETQNKLFHRKHGQMNVTLPMYEVLTEWRPQHWSVKMCCILSLLRVQSLHIAQTIE